LRLGVNIDHVATLRNARGGRHPDPLRAARVALGAGADSITVHLREDRRHIVDDDVEALLRELDCPVNLEIAATGEMVAIAGALRPHAVCIVPERRQERTTEGGLDAVAGFDRLMPVVHTLTEAGSRVALFVEPAIEQLEAARALGAPAVELHTGRYCDSAAADRPQELARMVAAAARCDDLGLECHAGHGLTEDNVGAIAAIAEIVELNIGHYLVGEALFIGLDTAIRRMRTAMNAGRAAGVAAERP
jgi:pyridoxine 5-phosphate synthase